MPFDPTSLNVNFTVAPAIEGMPGNMSDSAVTLVTEKTSSSVALYSSMVCPVERDASFKSGYISSYVASSTVQTAADVEPRRRLIVMSINFISV